MSLSLVDYVVIILIFLLTFGSVFWATIKYRRSKNQAEDSYEPLLMGRSISMPLFVASLVSSWYGGISGVTALTYEKGLFNFLTQGVFWYVAYLIFALILIRKLPRSHAMTFPDLIGHHLGPKARMLSSVLNIINLLPIACVLNLGILIQFLTKWPLFISSAFGVALVLSYALRGGLRSVVYADVVQFVAMILAVSLVVVFAIWQHGSPLKIIPLLPSNHLKLTGGEPLSEVFIWGFIAISTLADPLFYQRALAARSKKQAITGVLIATLIWFGFDCCTTLGSLYAKAYFPKVDANESYFIFAFSVLPEGLRGLFVAGIFSAALSTLDANLFTASSILSYDLCEVRGLSRRKLQLAMIAVGLMALLSTRLFGGSVASVWKFMGSISASCLLAPWLLMLLIPRTKSEAGFIWAVFSGTVMMLLGVVVSRFSQASIDPFYFGLLGSILGLMLKAFKRPHHIR